MKKYYYDIEDDIKDYPEAWCYIVIGGRNTGKTYGALKSCLINNRKEVFIKRTIDDIRILTSGSGKIGTKKKDYSLDLSPYKSINRDLNTNIKAFSVDASGLGGFWKCDDEEEPIGEPIGYLLALSAVQKFKGFDLSDCDWIIFDEFIPQPWERVNRKEGEQLMDLYKTVARDREHRGREALKLICLANATSASNPVTNVLEITDDVVDMELHNESIRYLEDRGILIHRLVMSEEFNQVEKDSAIYKAMGETNWGRMAFDNQFGYNDFSNVGRVSLKNFKPYIHLKYKNDDWYIYSHEDGRYYMTYSKQKCILEYDLTKENGQKNFFKCEYLLLKQACIEGRFYFETYTMYDVFINYKKVFVL